MKAVILAGGLGTRISEETSTRPKPMVEIGGRPILWHIMKTYSAHGINDFVICCGYKGYIRRILAYMTMVITSYTPAHKISRILVLPGQNSTRITALIWSILNARQQVFNYFSHTQDLEARFLITDITRAIRDKTLLKTSPDYIVRDFLHPSDFHHLVSSILVAPPTNDVVDCYTLSPVDKHELLVAMQKNFGLKYEVAESNTSVNATGGKPHYYSLNRRAANFGYQPRLTSLQGVLAESHKLLELRTIGFKLV